MSKPGKRYYRLKYSRGELARKKVVTVADRVRSTVRRVVTGPAERVVQGARAWYFMAVKVRFRRWIGAVRRWFRRVTRRER